MSSPPLVLSVSVSFAGSALVIATWASSPVIVTLPALPDSSMASAPTVPLTVTASTAASPAPLTPRFDVDVRDVGRGRGC